MPRNNRQSITSGSLIFLCFVLMNACGPTGPAVLKTGTADKVTETTQGSSTVTIPVLITETAVSISTTVSHGNNPIGGNLISEAQETLLVESLQSETCELPCYLNITPGKTSWPLVQQILSNLGAEYLGDQYYESGTGMRGYTYQILLGESASQGAAESTNPISPLDTTQFLSYLVGSDQVVQRTTVSLSALSQHMKFQDYWSRYSPDQVFARLGQPDSIYYSLGKGNGMTLVYETRGIVLIFSGRRDGESVCPNFEYGDYAGREFILTNTASDLSLIPEKHFVQLTNRKYSLPISEALGIHQQEFYDRIVAEPSVCFELLQTK